MRRFAPGTFPYKVRPRDRSGESGLSLRPTLSATPLGRGGGEGDTPLTCSNK